MPPPPCSHIGEQEPALCPEPECGSSFLPKRALQQPPLRSSGVPSHRSTNHGTAQFRSSEARAARAARAVLPKRLHGKETWKGYWRMRKELVSSAKPQAPPQVSWVRNSDSGPRTLVVISPPGGSNIHWHVRTTGLCPAAFSRCFLSHVVSLTLILTASPCSR